MFLKEYIFKKDEDLWARASANPGRPGHEGEGFLEKKWLRGLTFPPAEAAALRSVNAAI